MAHTDNLPEGVMNQIARQVGERLADVDPNRAEFLFHDGGESPPAVHLENETFEVWILEQEVIEKFWSTGKDLIYLAKSTGRWHHQIKIEGRDQAFARSAPRSDGALDWAVHQLFFSPLATKIEDAINWLDAHVEQDYLVRLLNVPAYQLTALWLIDESASSSYVLPVSIPSRPEGLRTDRLLSSTEFLTVLHEQQTVSGMNASQ